MGDSHSSHLVRGSLISIPILGENRNAPTPQFFLVFKAFSDSGHESNMLEDMAILNLISILTRS